MVAIRAACGLLLGVVLVLGSVSEGVSEEVSLAKTVNNWYDQEFQGDCDFCVSYLSAKLKLCEKIGGTEHDCSTLDQNLDCTHACELHSLRTGESVDKVCKVGKIYSWDFQSAVLRHTFSNGPDLIPRCWKIHRSLYSWGSIRGAYQEGCFTADDPECRPEDLCDGLFEGDNLHFAMRGLVSGYDRDRPDDWYNTSSDMERSLILDAFAKNVNLDMIIKEKTAPAGGIDRMARMKASRETLRSFCKTALPDYIQLRSRTLAKNPCETQVFAIDMDTEQEYESRKCVAAERFIGLLLHSSREVVLQSSDSMPVLGKDWENNGALHKCFKPRCPVEKLCEVFTASFKYDTGSFSDGTASCGLGTVGRGWDVNKYSSCHKPDDIPESHFDFLDRKYSSPGVLKRSPGRLDITVERNEASVLHDDTRRKYVGGTYTSMGSAEDPELYSNTPRFRSRSFRRQASLSDDMLPTRSSGGVFTKQESKFGSQLHTEDDEYAKGIPDVLIEGKMDLDSSSANNVLKKLLVPLDVDGPPEQVFGADVSKVVAALKRAGSSNDPQLKRLWLKAIDELLALGYIILLDRNERLYIEELPGSIRTALKQYQSSFGRLLMKKAPLSSFTAHCGSKFSDRDEDSKMEEITKYMEAHGPALSDIRGLKKYLDTKPATWDNPKLRSQAILDFIKDNFVSYNAFFYRHMERDARLIRTLGLRGAVVSAADSRLLVFDNINDSTSFWIKGEEFSVSRLVSGQTLAKYYEGGSMAIFRLAPQDYHRFHIPIRALIGPSYPYDGGYYSVSPLAVHSPLNVFTKNKRVHTELFSELFGRVAYVSIGATCVGSVVLTSREGQFTLPGEEHGYMAFGGSTVVVFFKKGAVQWAPNLLRTSHVAVETIVKMGDFVGVCGDVAQDDTFEERTRAKLCKTMGRVSIPDHIRLRDFKEPDHYQDFRGMDFEEILEHSEEVKYYWDNEGFTKSPKHPNPVERLGSPAPIPWLTDMPTIGSARRVTSMASGDDEVDFPVERTTSSSSFSDDDDEPSSVASEMARLEHLGM